MMFDLRNLFRKYLQYLLYLIAIYLVLWAITMYKPQFLGLIIGTVIGIFNLWLMVRKTSQISEAAVSGKKVRSIGTFSRLAAAILGVIISMKYPEYVSIIFFVLGLMTIYFVIIIDFAIRNYKSGKGEER